MNVGYSVGEMSAGGDIQSTTKRLEPCPRREDFAQVIMAIGANNLCLGKSHSGRLGLSFPWETRVVRIRTTFFLVGP